MLFRKAALIRLSFIRNAHPLTQDFPRTFVSKFFPTTRRMSSSSNSNNNGSGSYVSTAAASSSLDAPPPQEGYLRVREGSVYMDYDEKEAVFYNKVQEFNRDISCQVIRLFAEQREKEKEDKFQKRINAWNVVCAKQEALAARESGKDYDKSIDLNKVTPLVKGFTDPKSNTFGVPVECYTDPSKPNGKDIRKPFQEPKGIHILDALAATGLRSVRYLKEIPNVRKVTVNDIIPEAAPAQRENCAKNGVEFFDAGAGAGAESSADISTNTTSAIGKASISTADAVQFMYANKSSTVGLEAFDVIDLDPYGTAAPFLDSAVQSVSHGGLLNVTCTDMAVLSGNFPEKCFSLYGTVGLKARFYHEASLRTLLHALDSAANKHGRYIVPWLSLSVDFYIRVFVRVFDSPAEVKKSLLRRVMVHQSTQCESFYMQQMGAMHHSKRGGGELYAGAHATAPNVCPETGSQLRVGGPYWSGQLHDQNVCDELLRRITYGDSTGAAGPGSLLPYPVGTARRIQAVLASISEELKDVPFYYSLPDVSANIHSPSPTMAQMRNALNNAGYRFSHFHHEPMSVKTDAPPQVVWDIMRQFCIENPPVGSKHKAQTQSAKSILSKEMLTEVSFKPDPHNKWARSKQGIFDVPENTASISYSLTHRNSDRNKIPIPTRAAAQVGSGDAAGASGGDATTATTTTGPSTSSNRNREKARFPVNPERGWGPKRKALGKGGNSDDEDGGQGCGQQPQKRYKKDAGRGKEYYMELNKEKAEAVRKARADARAKADESGK